jgi:hypothetical protein
MSRTGIQQTLINHVYKCNLRLVNTRYRNFVTYITKKKKIKVYWYYDQAIYYYLCFLNPEGINYFFRYFNKETLKSTHRVKYRDGLGLTIYENVFDDELPYAQYDNKVEKTYLKEQWFDMLNIIITEDTNIYVKVQKALEFFHMIIMNLPNN